MKALYYIDAFLAGPTVGEKWNEDYGAVSDELAALLWRLGLEKHSNTGMWRTILMTPERITAICRTKKMNFSDAGSEIEWRWRSWQRKCLEKVATREGEFWNRERRPSAKRLYHIYHQSLFYEFLKDVQDALACWSSVGVWSATREARLRISKHAWVNLKVCWTYGYSPRLKMENKKTRDAS